MSYISAVRRDNDVLVWERNNGVRETRTFPAPYFFYIPSSNGEYQSIYGDRLTKYSFDSYYELNQGKIQCQSRNVRTYESDIPPELKVLSENYYNAPIPQLHITFFDIEVDYSKDIGFASANNPYAPINSVALYHTHFNKYVVLAIPPETEPTLGEGYSVEFTKRVNDQTALPDNTEIILCKDERDLLLQLLVEIEDSDIISGWNSDFFDVPYVGKRLEKLGKKFFRKLSFPEGDNPKWREVEVFGNVNQTLDLSGRISADYMVLFRKYEMSERQSYKLESVADDFLPDLPKMEYEGSLANLYREDFAKFIRYNIRDTEILHGLESLLGYVDLANQMYHLSTGIWKHVSGTLKLAELATINYCHHELDHLIVNDINPSDESASIQGAFVLEPKVGMHENIGSVDIKSLYPSSIRSLNISPETLIGQFTLNSAAADKIASSENDNLILEYDSGEQESMSAAEWRSTLVDREWAVSGYGTVFSQATTGIIPDILSKWYATRKEYQKLATEADKGGDDAKATYYDKLQYVYKIRLNSFYGALTNQYFRFYDLRMGESTTGTGRMILKHQCAKANEIMTGTYDDNGEAVIYGDTDSTYFKTWIDNPSDAIKVADRVGELITESFPEYMRTTFLCQPGFDGIIETDREIVSDRGIFVDKKRYILHMIDKEGKPVDKMKVMGLDTKKTTMPKHVSDKLNHFIERHLKGEPWEDIAEDIVQYKEHLERTEDIMSIGLPKGVKKVEHYTKEYQLHGNGARLPGHIAASILYNICRDHFEDKESMPIHSGMKIKVFYLNHKVDRFKSIAIPVDIEQIPSWFDDFSVDRKAHIERLVDNPLKNIIKAINKDVPTRQSLLVESALEF